MPLHKLPPRQDLVEGVYLALSEAITDGALSPGERLTQEDIARQLAVSRSPVLQALRLLKKDGLIQDAPGRGVLVAPLDPEDVQKLYDVRGALDLLATRRAVERGAKITPELLSAGRRAAASAADFKPVVAADLAFHFAIYEASGNELITESAQRHWMHLRRVMGARHQHQPAGSRIWDEHQAMAEAINRGDLNAALAHTEQHIQRARRELVQQLTGAKAAA